MKHSSLILAGQTILSLNLITKYRHRVSSGQLSLQGSKIIFDLTPPLAPFPLILTEFH